MKYTGISPRERRLTDELSRRNITLFTPMDASNILKESRENTYRILSRMEDKGLIERIEKGKYLACSSMDRMHIYEIATKIVTPSYLSLWSALHHYGYTTQVPRTAFVMTTAPKSGLCINNQKIKFVKTIHFFGYRSEGALVIAEPEKLFIDCLLYPHYAGGINEIATALEEAELREDIIIEYAKKIDNRALNSRLGYLLEITGTDVDRLEISRTPVPLDLNKKGGDMIKRWNIIENVGL